MLFVYPAIFHEEDEAYWVEFPDLSGCHTCGDTIPEAMEAAQEALAAYLLVLLEQGLPLATPSDMAALRPENGFASLVSCTVDPYRDTKAVKKTLTIPAWLNDRATAMGLNFSKILQDALLAKVQA